MSSLASWWWTRVWQGDDWGGWIPHGLARVATNQVSPWELVGRLCGPDVQATPWLISSFLVWVFSTFPILNFSHQLIFSPQKRQKVKGAVCLKSFPWHLWRALKPYFKNRQCSPSLTPGPDTGKDMPLPSHLVLTDTTVVTIRLLALTRIHVHFRPGTFQASDCRGYQ